MGFMVGVRVSCSGTGLRQASSNTPSTKSKKHRYCKENTFYRMFFAGQAANF